MHVSYFLLLHTESLKKYFEKFGEVKEAVVKIDKEKNRPRYGHECFVCVSGNGHVIPPPVSESTKA